MSMGLTIHYSLKSTTPSPKNAREHIAQIYEQLGRVPEAVAEWLELARQYARLRLFNRAKEKLRKAVDLEPQEPEHRRRLTMPASRLNRRLGIRF